VLFNSTPDLSTAKAVNDLETEPIIKLEFSDDLLFSIYSFVFTNNICIFACYFRDINKNSYTLC